MRTRRAILVNGFRIVRELIKRVLETRLGFEVVGELNDLEKLSTIIKRTNAGWVFLLSSSDQDVSDSQKLELLMKYPALRIVLLRMDDGRVSMEWLEHEHKDLTGLTLDELAHLLRKEWQSSEKNKGNDD